MKKLKTILSVVTMLAFVVGSASAGVISIDFNNTDASGWALSGSDVAGPLGSTNWNTTTTAAGTGQSLVDDTGAATTATITWSARNTWYNNDGNTTLDRALSHAYLDDGDGISITVENIPYAHYKVYGLFASDKGYSVAMRMLDFQVNGSWVIGGASAVNGTAVYGSVNANGPNNGGENWTEINPGITIGNYWTMPELTASTLTINGLGGNGTSDLRGSLTGVIIEETPVPSLEILSFVADNNQTYTTSDVTVGWRVVGATNVSIKLGSATLTNSTARIGNLVVNPVTGENVYTLTASSEGGSIQTNLTFYGVDPAGPAIVDAAFDAGAVANLDLTAMGTEDWILWGSHEANGIGDDWDSTSIADQMDIGTAIGTMTYLATDVMRSTWGTSHTFDYSNGSTPVATNGVSGDAVCLWSGTTDADWGDNDYMEFTVETTSLQEHTLFICGAQEGLGTEIKASLPGAITNTRSLAATASGAWTYSVTFKPQNVGDILTVRVKTDGTFSKGREGNMWNNLRVKAAALSVYVAPPPTEANLAISADGANVIIVATGVTADSQNQLQSKSDLVAASSWSDVDVPKSGETTHTWTIPATNPAVFYTVESYND